MQLVVVGIPDVVLQPSYHMTSHFLQALGNAINDSLGEALFNYKTAAAGLPMSAEIRYITNDPGALQSKCCG